MIPLVFILITSTFYISYGAIVDARATYPEEINSFKYDPFGIAKEEDVQNEDSILNGTLQGGSNGITDILQIILEFLDGSSGLSFGDIIERIIPMIIDLVNHLIPDLAAIFSVESL